MYFITTKRMLEVCFSAHPNIQYRTLLMTVTCARSVQVIVVRRPYESRHWLRSLSYDWFAAEVTDMHQAIGFSSINVTAPFSTSMKNGISDSSESEKLRPQSMKRYCVSAVSLSMVRDRLGLWI